MLQFYDKGLLWNLKHVMMSPRAKKSHEMSVGRLMSPSDWSPVTPSLLLLAAHLSACDPGALAGLSCKQGLIILSPVICT